MKICISINNASEIRKSIIFLSWTSSYLVVRSHKMWQHTSKTFKCVKRGLYINHIQHYCFLQAPRSLLFSKFFDVNTSNVYIFLFYLFVKQKCMKTKTNDKMIIWFVWLMFLAIGWFFYCFVMSIFGNMFHFEIYLHNFLLIYYQWLNDLIIRRSGRIKRINILRRYNNSVLDNYICQKQYGVQF